jgi:hypothetical protein
MSGEMMSIDTSGVVVSPGAGSWRVTAPMRDDNGNATLPTSFRRWWHFEVTGLDAPGGTTLDIAITRAGYSDIITPVWSLDGGLTYQRVPDVRPVFASQQHSFTITTPPGVDSIRLAKYFPYTLGMFDRFRDSVAGHPFVQERVIGQSGQGRDIVMHTLTDPTVPDADKRRVWVHAAVHPAETPAIFMAEGLVGWLTGGSSEAQTLLGNTIVNVVTMANPDGVALGNYRTNAASVNLENQWAAPYTSTVPEIVALRGAIEGFMGTATAPGANPITLLLNLHASHGGGYPFHFIHQASYPTSGVTAEVRALEDRWVAALKGRSEFAALRATDPVSTLSGRPFVESMMHDRYTLLPAWDPVMAITFEGTYELGPIAGVPNTPDDYRRLGADMGLAIADYYDVDLTPVPIVLFAASGDTRSQSAAGHPLMSGELTVRKLGGGTVVLDAINLNSGGILVEEGTLAVASLTAVASSRWIEVVAGAQLDVSALASGLVPGSDRVLSGDGRVLGSAIFGHGATLSPGTVAASARVHPVPEPPAGTTAWLALGGMLAGRRSRRRFVADLWG